MKIQPFFSLSVLGILLPLTSIGLAHGCTPPNVTAPPIALADGNSPAPDTATPPATIPDMTITTADKGKTIQLKVGQRLLVRLPSNPTTGYEWSAVKLNEKILTLDGETKFDVPETEMAGAPTIQTLFFKAKSVGTVKLELQYTRPWEKDKESVDIYTVNIITADNIAG